MIWEWKTERLLTTSLTVSCRPLITGTAQRYGWKEDNEQMRNFHGPFRTPLSSWTFLVTIPFRMAFLCNGFFLSEDNLSRSHFPQSQAQLSLSSCSLWLENTPVSHSEDPRFSSSFMTLRSTPWSTATPTATPQSLAYGSERNMRFSNFYVIFTRQVLDG